MGTWQAGEHSHLNLRGPGVGRYNLSPEEKAALGT